MALENHLTEDRGKENRERVRENKREKERGREIESVIFLR